jgi:hypothetical protein
VAKALVRESLANRDFIDIDEHRDVTAAALPGARGPARHHPREDGHALVATGPIPQSRRIRR